MADPFYASNLFFPTTSRTSHLLLLISIVNRTVHFDDRYSMVNSTVLLIPSLSGQLMKMNPQPFPFSPGFDVQKVAILVEVLPSHSWEFGAAAQALLELYNGSLSVFGREPFPVPAVDREEVKALVYAAKKITMGIHPANALADGNGAVGDPASLGVAAVMLGKEDRRYARAASKTMDYLVNSAPRVWNGAISQRVSAPELWFVLFLSLYRHHLKILTIIY